MKKGSKALIVFVSAAVTFASLMAFAGPEYFNKKHSLHSCNHSKETRNNKSDENTPGTLKQNN